MQTSLARCVAQLGLAWLALTATAWAQTAPKLNTLTPAEQAAGWILLFDGETLFGWEDGNAVARKTRTAPADPNEPAPNPINWQVVDGAIRANAGEIGLLCTTSEFADYQLHVEWRAVKNCNSGIFLRTALKPTDAGLDCYELNVAPPDNPFPTGSYVKRQKVEGAGETDGWRTYDCTLRGDHSVIVLDGKEVLNYRDPGPLRKGRIGLQHNMGQVEFRNIKLKPLGLKSIFNGKDLTGWKEFPGKASKWSVTEAGELRVQNGNGQLESAAQFADFVLQIDVFVNGKGLNSGLFFRSIPGEFWQGYESQIQNAYLNDDPTNPKDFGTGAFYRRQKARKIVSQDETWFTKTLVVSGNHMATWVNGYQVSDWTDDRAPNDNPRNGFRQAGGTLSLQGHDPTTDLRFRNIHVQELPANNAKQ